MMIDFLALLRGVLGVCRGCCEGGQVPPSGTITTTTNIKKENMCCVFSCCNLKPDGDSLHSNEAPATP